MAKNSPKPMHFEDADEEGTVIPGTTKNYARSIPPDDSPPRERPNTSRSRRDSKRRDSSPTPTFEHSDSDSTAHPSAKKGSKMKKSKEDRKGSSSKSKTLVVKDREPASRPKIKSHKTSPSVPPSRGSDESLYYGIPHQKTVASSRPRSHTRPLSYHAGSRPPLSGSAFYGQPPPPGPQGYPPPPFPPHGAWGPGPGVPPPLAPLAIPPMHHPPPPPQLPPPSPDFIRSNRELSNRFNRFDQPPPLPSAAPYHHSPLGYEPEPVSAPPRERTVGRRASVSSRKANKDIDDRARMPPPSRPKSTAPAPERKVLRPPPPTARKSVNFDDVLDDDESDLYGQSLPRSASVEYGSAILQGRSRRGSFSDESLDEDYERYQREAPRVRRPSLYNYEDKINNASLYQNNVNGGPGAPLTAETLKRVKNDGSRGSTRSSESRDESDWKHSATTRTTRSASVDPDDITIKLPEGAVVEVNGAKITCPGGGDVSLGRNNGTSRAGSDRGTSVYGDDRKSRYDDDRKSRYDDDRRSRFDDERRSRHERLPIRARASSQATNPYTRSLSYAPPYPHPYPHNPHNTAPYAPSFYDSEDYYYDSVAG